MASSGVALSVTLLLLVLQLLLVLPIPQCAHALPQQLQPPAPPSPLRFDAGGAPVVNTTCGPVRGSIDGGTASFKGVPYATPPVGSLRWQPPVTLQGDGCWSGTLSANKYAPACVQYGGPQPNTGQEDCLTLNIWAPLGQTSHDPTTSSWKQQQQPLLPVHVFFYGGDLTQGKTAWYG